MIFAFFAIITINGISAICNIIPGIAYITTLLINPDSAKSVPENPQQMAVAMARTTLPISIDAMSEMYINGIFLGKSLYKSPAIAPYAASSNAIHRAVGKNIGSPNISERKTGAQKPVKSPHCHPQINPQRNIGICIGQSIEFICGACPVKKGIMNASAKKSAENTIFLMSFFIFIVVLSVILKRISQVFR